MWAHCGTCLACRYAAQAAALKAAIQLHMWNGTAFCDGICDEISHTAFHSTVYLLAFGAVADENMAKAWAYVKGRIDPLGSTDGVADTAAKFTGWGAPRASWPPPPPPGVKDGMPCGTYVSQFVLQALYVGNPADHGAAGLSVLTSDAKNSWLTMIKRGATTTTEMWTSDEKPNLTWSHVWSASPGFIIPWFLFGLQVRLRAGLHLQ